MIYFIIPLLLAVGYHTMSYGIYLVKKEKNNLAATGTFILMALSLVTPVVVIILRY